MKTISTENDCLEIYVDSSVTHNQGGIGIRILSIDNDGNEAVSDYQYADHLDVKSGQMEINGCIYALKIAMQTNVVFGKKSVKIYTDSKYVSDNYKIAMFQWVENNWLRSSGRPVPDAVEWRELVKQIRKYNVQKIYVDICWVKGHSTNPHNIAVDRLAKAASRLPRGLLPRNAAISAEQPKKIIAPAKLEIGSVKMKGQKASIKILEIEYLQVQQLWCVKYTVITERSSYYGCVDKFFSIESFDIGKSYYVKFNNDTSNPRIERVYREITPKRKKTALSN